jgi:WD40 repeat protein
VAFSPDGEFYVFASPDGRLQYRRAQDGVVLQTFYQCCPQAVVFSANGQLLASAGGSGDEPTMVKVTRVADGALLCKVQSEAGSKPLLSFSPDGLLLASSDGKSGLNLWQLPAGTLKQSVAAGGNISALTWSKDGQDVVVICADGKAERFQVKLPSPLGK